VNFCDLSSFLEFSIVVSIFGKEVFGLPQEFELTVEEHSDPINNLIINLFIRQI
jgi:hypothetical protein